MAEQEYTISDESDLDRLASDLRNALQEACNRATADSLETALMARLRRHLKKGQSVKVWLTFDADRLRVEYCEASIDKRRLYFQIPNLMKM